MKKIIISSLMALLPAICSLAQDNDSLRREVTITKEFTPIVRKSPKINTMPSVATPSFNRKEVDYSYTATATNVPTVASEVAVPYKSTADNDAYNHRGYLDFGIGAYLSIFANAGYHILDTPHDQLNAGLQFTSLNWDIPVNSHAPAVTESTTHQTFYDMRAGLRYAHTFDNDIAISLHGAYRYLDFNYYGVAGVAPEGAKSHPFNSVNNLFAELRVDNKKAKQYDYEHWYIVGGYSLYQNKRGVYVPNSSNEHHAYVNSGYSYMLDKHWSVGGEIDLDYLQYNGLISRSDCAPMPAQHLFMARLLPNVEYKKEHLFFRIGAKADISVNDGTVFRFAPDIHLNWEFYENYFLYADIDGGKKLHTWNDVSQYCIYFNPSFRVPSSYTPLDAKAGFRFRFIPELALSAYAGYEVASGALFQSPEWSSQAIVWRNLDASCFKFGARIDADVLQYVTLSLDVAYREWKQKNASIISYDRPRWEGNARVTVHPHKSFDIEVAYNMQLGRDFGEYGKLNDIHNLQVSAAYHPLSWLSLFAQGSNLLDCKYDYYYGMPATRIQAMVGVELKF